MCGLIGSFRSRDSAGPIPLEVLRHRGPDATGEWFSSDGRCWLGHTRLAIQDLSSAGAQPITSHCGRFTLVFNGEIYNHQHVRLGLRFQDWRGHSDSETLVEGLAQRGPALLLELRGMFAFAAYDREKGQLLLARDRLGIKPLYLAWQEDGLLFASERRALPGSSRLDMQMITQLMAFGHESTPALFRWPDPHEIVSLPAGLVVRINHSRSHDPVRYWPPQPRPDWSPLPIRNKRCALRFLRHQLEEVVTQHLLADVPLACFLSSGLDSGILTSLACQIQPGGVSSFTVALPGTPEDESMEARKLARHCGSQHHELVIGEDQALSWVEQALAALDVPTADGVNTYLVSRAVSQQGIKVALSGLGADELFGGYPSHRLLPWLMVLRWLPSHLRQHALKIVSPRLAQKLMNLPSWNRWYLGLAVRRWSGDEALRSAGLPPLSWPVTASQRISQAWGQTSWSELFGYTEPMLLRDSDVMSMACGIELRVPFLDHQLVETALRMPQYFQSHGKTLLRQSCADLFPRGYLNRPKQGFALPMSTWMRGPLQAMCQHRLNSLKASGLIHPQWIDNQWSRFIKQELNWPIPWCLVVLGEFHLRSG